MSGIRLINSPPETFRYPEWRDDIFYVKDSVVRYASYMAPPPGDSDSDNLITKFYIAIADVDPGSGIPPTRLDLWGAMAESATAVGQVVAQIIDNDSDIYWLRQNLHNIKLEHDSDKAVTNAKLDSELKIVRHNFRAADSDLVKNIDSNILSLKDYDSDFKVDYDSDLLATYHDFIASDSDLRVDIDSDITVVIHNYMASDSDITAKIDSEFHDLRAFDSDVNELLTLPSWDYGTYTF